MFTKKEILLSLLYFHCRKVINNQKIYAVDSRVGPDTFLAGKLADYPVLTRYPEDCWVSGRKTGYFSRIFLIMIQLRSVRMFVCPSKRPNVCLSVRPSICNMYELLL